jgi:hypothetical protein
VEAEPSCDDHTGISRNISHITRTQELLSSDPFLILSRLGTCLVVATRSASVFATRVSYLSHSSDYGFSRGRRHGAQPIINYPSHQLLSFSILNSTKHEQSFRTSILLRKRDGVPSGISATLYTGSLSTCGFLTFYRRLSTMVNWHDPALLLNDYCASRDSVSQDCI